MNIDLRERLRANLPEFIGELRAKTAEHDRPYNREAGYTVRAVDDDTTVLRIYDEIWFLGANAEDIAADLDDVTTPNIRVEINSPGGDVFDGIAIYNTLRNHPATVTTRIDGVAASIASIVAQAGDRREVMSAGQMMIHNAWGMTVGDAADHDDMRQLLEQQDAILAGIYARRSGRDVDHFRQLMAAETWLTDEQALEEGLVDAVVDPPSKTTETSDGPDNGTFNDEITAAMDVVRDVIDGAERVAALRADAGKTLSAVNCEGLAGLRDAVADLDRLLAAQDNGGEPDWDAVNELARFVAHNQKVET